VCGRNNDVATTDHNSIAAVEPRANDHTDDINDDANDKLVEDISHATEHVQLARRQHCAGLGGLVGGIVELLLIGELILFKSFGDDTIRCSLKDDIARDCAG
jgi:hypothetical protein